MAYRGRGLVAAIAGLMAATPGLAFELIAGPAGPDGGPQSSGPAISATAYAPSSTAPYDAAPWFGEARLGSSVFLDSGGTGEGGAFATAAIFIDPLASRFESAFADTVLAPRLHFGLSATPSGGTNQLFAGFTWDAHLTDLLFVEASFGGSVHDGPLELDDEDAGLALGCRFHFRESAGVGIELSERLRLVTSVDHASDGGLCGEGGDSLVHAGASLGLKF